MREKKAREYLKTIFVLELEGVVRGAYIAREMGVTKATVSVALKALTEEGFLVMESDHSVRLTERGKQVAKESIHQTVSTGRNYHEIIQHIQAYENDPASEEKLAAERALRWLKKERCSELLEAWQILSRRFYCVRVVDLAHFLDLSSATVRGRLRRLEKSGYAHMGEDSVVTLSSQAEELAAALYAEHAGRRELLQEAGLAPDEAERRAIHAEE